MQSPPTSKAPWSLQHLAGYSSHLLAAYPSGCSPTTPQPWQSWTLSQVFLNPCPAGPERGSLWSIQKTFCPIPCNSGDPLYNGSAVLESSFSPSQYLHDQVRVHSFYTKEKHGIKKPIHLSSPRFEPSGGSSYFILSSVYLRLS